MNTAFLLLAEFGAADVPVELVAERYLALDAKTAKARATILDARQILEERKRRSEARSRPRNRLEETNPR